MYAMRRLSYTFWETSSAFLRCDNMTDN